MKKYLLILIVLLIQLSDLSAKTIWFKDLTDDRFTKFYNSLKTSLDESRYGKNMHYVNNNIQMSVKPGDIVLELSGLYSDLSGGGIWCHTIVMCVVGEDKEWHYRNSFSAQYSWQFIIEQANDSKTRIINFLDKYF